MNLIAKRLIAFLIDYLILGCYAGVLALCALRFHLHERVDSPWASLAIGFLSLTLPVILYFTLMENGRKQSTFGKRAMRLVVTSASHKKATLAQLAIRNMLKFLPWEIAHIGVHWAFFYSRQSVNPPVWVWIPLVVSQVLAVVYLIGIAFSANQQGLYELASRTRVLNAPSKP